MVTMKNSLFLIFFCCNLYALPPCHKISSESKNVLCNPCVDWCQALSYHVGYLGDFIYDREMQLRQGGQGGSIIQDTQIFSQGVTLTASLQEWIRFTLFLGSSSIEISSPAEANRFLSLWEFEPNFCWDLDLTTEIVRYKGYTVFFSGAYFRTETTLKSYYDLGGGGIFTFDEKGDATYRNWQLSLGGSYEIKSPHGLSLIPYAVLKYSGARLHFSGEAFIHEGTLHLIEDLQNRKTLGYGIGCRAKIVEAFVIGIENRLADDRAVMVFAEFLF